MSFKNKSMFYALAFCSFLGFSVQPVRANDTFSTRQDSISIESGYSLSVAIPDSLNFHGEKKKSTRRKRRRKRNWFKKKRKFTPVGCPSF